MRFWVLPFLLAAVEGMRSHLNVADQENTAVVGKVVKCRVGGALVFDKAADESQFSGGWESIDEAGVKGWGINIPKIVRIVVDPRQLAAAKQGFWTTTRNYEVFTTDIDSSGLAMRNSLPDKNGFKGMTIVWDSPYTLRVVIHTDEENVIIDLTKGTGRIDFPATDYYMPTQGTIISLKVDGKIVYNQDPSSPSQYPPSQYPVVCTPALFRVSKIARGLDVNVAELTWFWVWMTEMKTKGYFGPNSHGYTNSSELDEESKEMLEGLKRWWHRTTEDHLDHDANLTLRSDPNTVEISGNGTELVFSKEHVKGKLIKCTVGTNDLFNMAEEKSVFTATWGYYVDETDGADGWYVEIPKIVKFGALHKSMVKNPQNISLTTYDTPWMALYTDDDIDESGLAMRNYLSGGTDVHEISTEWNSHKRIKIMVRMDDKPRIKIEFTRGPTASKAEHYDKWDHASHVE